MSNSTENLPQIHNKPLRHSVSIPNTFALKSLACNALLIEERADFALISEYAQQLSPVYIVGGGSNLILPNQLGGLVVLMRQQDVHYLGEQAAHHYIDVVAGEVWHDWVLYAEQQGWPGLENLALIPGTVGAAPVQNIGAYGLEVAQFIDSVEIWDIEQAVFRRLTRDECQFSYRDSVFKTPQGQQWVIASVRFALPVDWQPCLNYPELRREVLSSQGEETQVRSKDILQAVIDIRRRKLPDPSQIPNAGSFFKNPIVSAAQYESLLSSNPQLVAYEQPSGEYKLAAGWLIDQCGWKGRALGNVRVHQNQALVLTNTGHASASDVVAIAQKIRADVQARFGVTLEQEPVNWA